jgi:hypothetical protein
MGTVTESVEQALADKADKKTELSAFLLRFSSSGKTIKLH